MKKFDVSIVAELTLQKLKSESKLSAGKLLSYGTIGFRTVVKYFEDIGNLNVDKAMLQNFLEYQYEQHKHDKKLLWRWKFIRRSTELLLYFVSTGRIDMPPLPRWTRRDCQLYVEPSPEQLADNDNIYGLTWRTRKALGAFGYTKRTMRYYNEGGFLKILNAHEAAGTEVYSGKLCANAVLKEYELFKSNKRHRYQAVRKAASWLDEIHRYGSIIPAVLDRFEKVPLNPLFEALLDEYANNALFSGQLGAVSAAEGKSKVKGFLFDLENAGFFSFETVTLPLISDAIAKTAYNRYKHGAGSLLHYVRSFLKYLFEYGFTNVDLSLAIPKMASPVRKVYQGFSDDEIRQLLAAVDRSTLIGKRDYAMMMLAAQTGLRAIDVVKLKRGDIDWRNREIRIFQSKTGKPLCLVLETESGNAIYDYLINGRQNCDIPNVFLRAVHPLGALSTQSLRYVIFKYMAIAGITSDKHQRYGFHSFRRAFGTRLLESGTPVQLLSQLLGHTNLDSARPYLSASELGLKACGLSLTLNESGGDAI